MHELPYLSLLGSWAQPYTCDRLVADIVTAGREGRHVLVGNHNLHSIALLQHDAALRAFYERCGMVFIDGMPLIWLGMARGYHLRVHHRCTVVDWMPHLYHALARAGLRLAFIGGGDGVGQHGLDALRRRTCPELELSTHCESGFFDRSPGSIANTELIARVNTFAPHVLCIGMGMPMQERWLLDNYQQLNAGCMITVGAVLDYYAGAIPLPPRWMGRCGLEWFYRLSSEPVRLGHRYVIEPWSLLDPVLADFRRPRRAVRSGKAPPFSALTSIR